MKRWLFLAVFLILVGSALAIIKDTNNLYPLDMVVGNNNSKNSDHPHISQINFDEQSEISVIVMLKDKQVKQKFGAMGMEDKKQFLEDKKEMIKEQQEKVLGGLAEKKMLREKGKFGTLAEEKTFTLKHQYSTVNGFSGKITKEAYEELKNDPEVKEIFLDRTFTIALDQSVPQINTTATWAMVQNYSANITGAGQTICIVDTGIDYNHTALGGGWGNKVIGGFRSLSNETDVQECAVNNSACFDDHGHGTHVAGIVASNDSTYRGVAPEAKLLALKVCDASGSCEGSDMIAAIDWCTNNASQFNISVISMSLGDCSNHTTYCNNDELAPSINTAVGQGIVVTVSAGNGPGGSCTGISNTVGPSSPACVENATAIGAVDGSDTIYYQRGPLFELMAPGISIHSANDGGGFLDMTGTSMAAPHAAGAAALLQQFTKLQNGTALTPAQVKTVLNSTGKILNDSGGSGYYFSRINIYAAILSLDNVTPTASYISPTPDNASSIMTNYATIKINASETVNATLNFNGTNYSMSSAGGTIYQSNVTNLSKAIYNFTVYLVDLSGKTAQLSTRIFTINNTAPNITSYTPSTTTVSVVEGSALFFNHTSTDADNDPLTYGWYLNGTLQAATAYWNYTPNYTAAGYYNATLIVSDSFNQASQSWNLTVNNTNRAPVAYILSPTNGSHVELGNATSFTTNSTDADGESLTYLWNFGDGSNSTTANTTHSFSTINNFTVTLAVNDSIVAANYSIRVNVTDKTAPVFNSISYSTSIYAGNDLTVSVNITDYSNITNVTLDYNSTTTANNSPNGQIYSWLIDNPTNGSHTFVVNATDLYGYKQSASRSFTVNYCGDDSCQTASESCSTCSHDCGTCSSGSSSGGGAAGASTNLPSKVFTYSTLTSGTTYNLGFIGTDIPFTQMSFTPTANKNSVEILVAETISPPKTLENVYKYLQITLTNINDSEITGASVRFEINKTWFEGGYDPTKVSFYRYQNSGWVKLDTAPAGDDSLYYNYYASVPGFSYFAMAAEKKEVPVAAAPAPSFGVQEAAELPAPLEAAAPVNATAAEPSQEKTNEAWLLLLLIPVIIIVALVVYFTKYKKPEIKHETIGQKKGVVMSHLTEEHRGAEKQKEEPREIVPD